MIVIICVGVLFLVFIGSCGIAAAIVGGRSEKTLDDLPTRSQA
jgi:hypothetical protein